MRISDWSSDVCSSDLLHTEAAMLRQLIRSTAWQMDQKHHMEVTHLVAMCNYRANRLVCEAADRAMQTCGGVGYSRHMPLERSEERRVGKECVSTCRSRWSTYD